MELEHTVVNNDRVPGVHSTLVANHHICRAAEEIRDLPLSFVTPLRSDDDNVGQRHCGPKPRICTIRDYLRSAIKLSKELSDELFSCLV